MIMSRHGKLTAEIGESLLFENYDVIYDHGKKKENVRQIYSTLKENYLREDILSQIDIAIVDKGSEKSSKRAIALIEIEEKKGNPKSLLGNVFGALMGEYIYLDKAQRYLVDDNTKLIVFGVSNGNDVNRNKDLQDKVMKIKTYLSTGNSVIGKVIINNFAPTLDLAQVMKAHIDDIILKY